MGISTSVALMMEGLTYPYNFLKFSCDKTNLAYDYTCSTGISRVFSNFDTQMVYIFMENLHIKHVDTCLMHEFD